MGVIITANNSKTTFNCGYGGFMNLRNNIASAFDKEFGELYKNLLLYITENEINGYNEKVNKILSERFKDDEDIINFLFASDCEGKISYKTCKKIYDLIKNIDFGKKIFTYAAHSDGKDYEKFKNFLLECYKYRRNMVWY